MITTNYSLNFKGIRTQNGADQTRRLASKKLTETSTLIQNISIQTPKKERLTVFEKLCDSYKLFARALCYDIKNTTTKDAYELEKYYNKHDQLGELVDSVLEKTKAKGIKTPRSIQMRLNQISSNIDHSIYTNLESAFEVNMKPKNFLNKIIRFITRKA